MDATVFLPEGIRLDAGRTGSMFAPQPTPEARERMRREENMRRWLGLAAIAAFLWVASLAILEAGWA